MLKNSKNSLRHFLEQYHEGKIANFEQYNATSLYDDSLAEQADSESLEKTKRELEWLCRFSFIEDLMACQSCLEIIIHTPKHIQFELENNLEDKEINLDPLELNFILENFAITEGQTWNTTKPFVSFLCQRFAPSLFRVTLIHRELTPSKRTHKAFFRRVSSTTLPLKAFINSPAVELQLQNFVKLKMNIIVSGSTGSGKTSFIRALLGHAPSSEHIVCLEDTHEILPEGQNWTHLLSTSQAESQLDKFCAYALRMRPDRIILGELRSKEINAFSLVLNTGHRGTLATIHADSALETLGRLANLALIHGSHKSYNYNLAVEVFCKNIDIIIHLEQKKIKEIIEVIGCQNGRPIFKKIEQANQISQQ